MHAITSYVDSPLTRGQCFVHHHIDCPYQYTGMYDEQCGNYVG